MKFKITKVEIVEIDMEAERQRINDCEFSDDMRERLLKLCDLFEEGKYQECDELMDSWGKCPELECPEVEFVLPELRRLVIGALYWENSTIEQIDETPKPKCGNDGSSWQRLYCEYDEAGVCIHCKVEVPF